MTASASAAGELTRILGDLHAEELDDPRVRALLHEARKTLDRLLEQAERIHHPCRS